MTDRTFVETLRYGIHDSSDPTDFTGTPGTLKFLRAVGGWPLADGYNPNDRNIQSGDGAMVHSLRGTQRLEVSPLTVEAKGLSGASGRSGSTDTSSLGHDIDGLLEAISGASAVDATSDTTSGSEAGTGASLIVDASSGPLAALDMIAVADATNGDLHARQITSISGDPTLTMDRALTDGYGASVDPDEGAVVHAGRRYTLTPATGNPSHIYLDGERDNFRRIYWGAFANARLDFPSGDLAKLMLENVQCMRYTAPSVANPSYSDPTTGDPIKVRNSAFYVGSTLYSAYGFSLDFGSQHAPRQADGGEQNNFGYVRTRMMPRLRCTMLIGSGTTPTEVTSSQLETWRDDPSTLLDIGLQIGRSLGQMVYIRAPEARLRSDSTPKDDNGLQSIDVEFELTGSAPAYIGFF